MSEAWTGRFVGGGDCEMMKKLEERIAEARQKHPHWKCSMDYALCVLQLEIGELELAMRHETEACVKDEALDVAAVAMRIVAGDWK